MTSNSDLALAEFFRTSGLDSDLMLVDYVFAWASRHPRRVALVDDAGQVSYEELTADILRMADALRGLGLVPGDYISIALPNCREWVVAHLAGMLIGLITNPILLIHRERGIAQALSSVQSRILITVDNYRGFDYVDAVLRSRADVPSLEHVVVVGGHVSKREHVTSWREFMTVGQNVSPEDLKSLKPTADSAAVVFYTSGTTGSPKGVVHSHAALIGASVPWADRLGMSDGDAVHMTSPFGHLMGYQFGVSLPLILGGTGVFQAEWDPERFIALVDEWRVVHTSGATPFLFDLLRSLKDPTRVSSLKRFLCAGAPIPRALVEEAAHKLPMLAVLGAWGQTECGLISMCLPSDSEVKRRTTDGSALPGVKIRVQGDDGALLPPGSRGNLHVQSPFLFRQYLGDLAGTVNAFTPDGWFVTGDLGTVDSDGFVRISGRAKDLIIRGGENIPVVEIEEELLQHTQIRDVAIVGVPHERLQEIAAACVVLEDPLRALRLEDVQDYLRSRGVAKNYWPEILVIRESLPRTAIGKVQKFMLRRALEAAIR